jgi:hypothetical protein
MCTQVETESFAQLLHIIGQMVVGDAMEAVLAQCGRHTVGVGAADLVRRDRFARFHQFIAR